MIKNSGHLWTLDKCRKHSPAARVFYISLVFSNDRSVLWQCNTRLRLLYLLSITALPWKTKSRCLLMRRAPVTQPSQFPATSLESNKYKTISKTSSGIYHLSLILAKIRQQCTLSTGPRPCTIFVWALDCWQSVSLSKFQQGLWGENMGRDMGASRLLP